jgi:nicotinamidase-related amidase
MREFTAPRVELPIPPHFDKALVAQVWRVPYQQRAEEAAAWASAHELRPASQDSRRIGLLVIDYQNTFCLPEFELFVGGRSGTGAINDAVRLCEFIYRNLDSITNIHCTLDTHTAMQVFHSHFLIDTDGNHPAPMTEVSVEDIENGRWRVNPAVANNLRDVDETFLLEYLPHYCRTLRERGKYSLMIWPYHAMLGGIGHALVAAVEEAVFFHTVARQSQVSFEVKGNNPLTENYSALRPEVLKDHRGNIVAKPNPLLIDKLLNYDALVLAGQAKSHCVAWTIEDLLEEINDRDTALARKVYLLEDCTSPVCVPGVVDFTDQADAAFRRFAAAGVHIVQSTTSMQQWEGMKKA